MCYSIFKKKKKTTEKEQYFSALIKVINIPLRKKWERQYSIYRLTFSYITLKGNIILFF